MAANSTLTKYQLENTIFLLISTWKRATILISNNLSKCVRFDTNL